MELNQHNSIQSMKNGYADKQVMAAIKNSGGNSQLVLKWFFDDVKDYSLGVWRKKYRDIPNEACLLYTSPSPRDRTRSRMPSSA